MTEFRKLEIAHVPASLTVYAAQYSNLRNAGELLGELRSQNHELEYAFLDARKILSITVLQAAIFRAINDKLNGRMKSHNVHSEVVLALNLNNNIGESFRKFGMTEQTQDLLVVKIAAEPDAKAKMSQTLGRAVDGDQRPFGGDGALAPWADADEVRKLYRLDGAASKGARAGKGASGVSGSPPQSRLALESAILGLIALRGAT